MDPNKLAQWSQWYRVSVVAEYQRAQEHADAMEAWNLCVFLAER